MGKVIQFFIGRKGQVIEVLYVPALGIGDRPTIVPPHQPADLLEAATSSQLAHGDLAFPHGQIVDMFKSLQEFAAKSGDVDPAENDSNLRRHTFDGSGQVIAVQKARGGG